MIISLCRNFPTRRDAAAVKWSRASSTLPTVRRRWCKSQRLGLFPIAVDAAKAGAAASARRDGQKADLLSFLPPTLRAQMQQKRKPKLQELATFTTQLANLLHSGMPLTVALNSMTHLESKGIPAEVSRELKQEVSEGKGLSDAMAKQPRIFSDLYINMVRAGEQSGSLVEVLAAHGERISSSSPRCRRSSLPR